MKRIMKEAYEGATNKLYNLVYLRRSAFRVLIIWG